jgi:transposase-like protein
MRAISAGAERANGGAALAARFPSSDCRGKVHTVIIQNVGSTTLFPIIRARIKPDAVVYSDSFQAYDVLDVSEFRHMRINHRELFADRETISTASRTSGARPNVTCAATMASQKRTCPSLPQGMRMALQLPTRKPTARNLKNLAQRSSITPYLGI